MDETLPPPPLCKLCYFSTGIIKHGGVKPNIIPAYSELEFYLRTPLVKDLCDLKAKAEACFRAAAVATGCQVSLPINVVFHSPPSWLDACARCRNK